MRRKRQKPAAEKKINFGRGKSGALVMNNCGASTVMYDKYQSLTRYAIDSWHHTGRETVISPLQQFLPRLFLLPWLDFFLTLVRPNITKNRLHKHFRLTIGVCLMHPPFCCKTHLRRRHHSLLPDACKTFPYALLHIKSRISTKFPAAEADRG